MKPPTWCIMLVFGLVVVLFGVLPVALRRAMEYCQPMLAAMGVR